MRHVQWYKEKWLGRNNVVAICHRWDEELCLKLWPDALMHVAMKPLKS